MPEKPFIIYTKTDEAPALATRSFLPIVKLFAAAGNIDIQTRDISLSARILTQFPEFLGEGRQVSDDLAALGKLTQLPEANIIKLPNISASIPQLKAAIKELQGKGFEIPDYPEEPSNELEDDIKARYDKIKGSAVNPVLREGNSDRRAPAPVKNYAKKNPHRMGEWHSDSKTRVATMGEGDFFHSEQSQTMGQAAELTIQHLDEDGKTTVLKEGPSVQKGEIIDTAVMSKRALTGFLEKQIISARDEGVLFSLHLKATMMKVSDPVIFGHAVRTFFEPVFSRHVAVLEKAGVNANNGLGTLLSRIETLPKEQKQAVLDDIGACYNSRPGLAMVDSDRGITNLHVPSDVIIDASMPAMIRAGGKMWDKDGKTRDTRAVIPDSSYAGVYRATIDFCKEHGAFDPATMGSVSNVGLMAQKAEEYGSHDKTFVIRENGSVQVIDETGKTLMEHPVERGDIWRMCQVKDAPVRDWVKLAVKRALATGNPAVFWLDENRAHDAELIKKVKQCLKDHDTDGLHIHILPPEEATIFSLERIKVGKDTISVTGNVLRDYLTDLFPILEVGTSAKMLSIVPLMNGGGLFETGAGGSAPKHVQQFVEENHLRWDSLGEFMALAASLEHFAEVHGNGKARVLAQTLDQAVEEYLEHDRSPSRKAGEPDNRTSHFYLALYWAQALSGQDSDPELKKTFSDLAARLKDKEETVVSELNSIQGKPVDIGGYYKPDDQLADNAMRPCETLNNVLVL